MWPILFNLEVTIGLCSSLFHKSTPCFDYYITPHERFAFWDPFVKTLFDIKYRMVQLLVGSICEKRRVENIRNKSQPRSKCTARWAPHIIHSVTSELIGWVFCHPQICCPRRTAPSSAEEIATSCEHLKLVESPTAPVLENLDSWATQYMLQICH